MLKNPSSKIGVLLLNLGTPDGTGFFSVRRYLKEFLSDPRVIEMPRWPWWLLLNLIVLNTRPQKSGALYKKIWDKDADESPLRLISSQQAKKLQARFGGQNVMVDFAMRYGNPSTASKLVAMKSAGCDRILLMPLYPQYSATTSASANDKAFAALASMRWQPAVRTLPPYYAHPAYIGALAENITGELEKLDFIPQKLILSYHGMPQSYIDKGDPYFEHCRVTTDLLAKELSLGSMGLGPNRITMAFQSRFGRQEWLKPYLDGVLEEMPKAGTKNIAIIAPAFSVDCLETLEELAMEGKERFLAAGGENFAYIRCLNDNEVGMGLIETLCRQEMQGWV